MRPGSASTDLLRGFNAPLGTFSSRIKASYAFGLITEDQFKDLEYLRKIRNEFAHAWEHVSLQQDKLSTLVKNMSFSSLDDNYPESNADKVRTSITALLTDISSTAQQIHVKGLRLNVTGGRLVPLFYGEFSVQLQQAHDRLNNIREHCIGATGDRKRFCVHRLDILRSLLRILVTQVPKEMKSEVLSILTEVEQLRQ